ncbi:unnamed protein product [Phyllotreta striolata]|uniref:Nuclear pore complex protein Nup160 n=1 Tax=Phyllotreta striolata TaxID=444603 RepID=A0A9N9TTL3_PHYSR|nr:unnamed protein product [Phyllotreta striolata]
MSEFTLGYREVTPEQIDYENWKEITLTTGGTQSTLQDIKVAERANGYCYKDSTKHCTRNRFIYWRINHNVLELVEHSLDINLTGNRIRYKFDTPILDGVSIHEILDNVVILVPTVCSVHRLIFPHPNIFHAQDDLLGIYPDLTALSIFSKASIVDTRNPNSFYVFNNPSTANDQLPNLANSYFVPETGEAYFVLAFPSTELLLIRQSPDQVTCVELKGESLVPRFFAGIADKFRQRNSDSENIVSLLFYDLDEETYVLSLTQDAHLKCWSCSKGQCVAVIDVREKISTNLKYRVQSAILKKAEDGNSSDNILVLFLSFGNKCQFHILKPSIREQEISLHRLAALESPLNDLIDFAAQLDCLWSVWRSDVGETVVYKASFKSNQWTQVILEPEPCEKQFPIKFNDVKTMYLQHIFHPGRFPLHVINKTLSIYKMPTIASDSHLSISALKQRVCMAVENDIQNLFNRDGTDINSVEVDEYIECAEWCWQKFDSRCVQYQIASRKPLGLMLLPSVSGAMLLKKSAFSFLRPVDSLEHMTLCTDLYREQFFDFSMLADDLDAVDDVINVFKVIVYIEQQLKDDFMQSFETELLNLQSPDVVIEDLLKKIYVEMDSDFFSQILHLIKDVNDLYKAIHKILELLRYENTLANPDNDINPAAMYYFNSLLGTSLVAQSFRQQAEIRFQICRNLLLLCNFLVMDRTLNWGVLEGVRSVCMPDIVVLTQASFVVLWLSGLTMFESDSIRDSSMSTLNPLKLTPVYNLLPFTRCTSLLEVFISSSGVQDARKSFARVSCKDEALVRWHWSLLPYVNHIRHLIWPISGCTVFEEWLLSSGQHVWLQQYVRLLSNWCEWNACTRNFLLASSFLTTGEFYKAEELFETAAKGVFTDAFLKNRIKSVDESNSRTTIHYYLKVIQLFELCNARSHVINVANTALCVVKRDDPLAATLFSIKFKHHLALKHYQLAFDSLNSNPDGERRKDNLRDLVKTLLDEKKLNVLLNFTYDSMDEFFANIVLTRARAADVSDNAFYDFLYSYQIKKGPPSFRLAASAMYEQAFRLSQKTTVEALEKQVKCYLAAKNVLHLCPSQHAWVVRPADPDEEDEHVIFQPLAGSNGEIRTFKIKKQIEVVDIETIGKELTFASAKLKLLQFNPAVSISVCDPLELVISLNNSGMFKAAFEICSTFDLPYSLVFEALTKRCVMLTEAEDPNAWNWLVENDLQDLPVNRESAADVVWKFLQDCLEKYEEPRMSCLHNVVCKKIINMQIYLPHWLKASYKARNPSELLRLLHASGRLEEAVELAKDYILSAMGYGKEEFGFSQPLAPTSPAFCLPVYAIQRLVDELDIQNSMNVEKPYTHEYDDLKVLFSKYLETAIRVSNQMCQVKGRAF